MLTKGMGTNTTADPTRLKNSREHRTFKQIQITTVQKLLHKLGYDTIDPDGILGHETQNAILWFQCKNGIRVDGKVTSQFVALLQQKRNALEAATI